MITLNAIQISPFPPHQTRANFPKIRRKRYFVCSCSSQKENPDLSSLSSIGGDKGQQEILAVIALLEAEKVRVTDYIDERSKVITKVGEEANVELDEIGKDSIKDLDAAGERIMEKMDSQMLEFEESAEMRWREIEENDRILEDFEKKMERGRNENLFFKNLKEKKSEIDPKVKKEAKLEAQKLEQLAKESAGSKVRRNLYLALMAVLALTIGNAILGVPEADVEWKKIAGLGLIFIGLVSQLIYEQDLSSKSFKEKDK